VGTPRDDLRPGPTSQERPPRAPALWSTLVVSRWFQDLEQIALPGGAKGTRTPDPLTLLCLSSRWLGPVVEFPVEMAGYIAFEAAADFAVGFAFRGSPESVDTLIELILLACPASLAAM
jgi:hypothetical protein